MAERRGRRDDDQEGDRSAELAKWPLPTTTYTEPLLLRALTLAGFAFLLAFPGFVIYLGISEGSVGGLLVGLAFQAMCLPLLADGIYWMTRVGVRIVVTDDGISATPVLGRTVSLRWTDIAETRLYSVKGFGGAEREQARLIARDGKRIALDERFREFDDLTSIVLERTPHAVRGEDNRSWWRRQFLPG
jgi:hypothetical protein